MKILLSNEYLLYELLCPCFLSDVIKNKIMKFFVKIHMINEHLYSSCPSVCLAVLLTFIFIDFAVYECWHHWFLLAIIILYKSVNPFLAWILAWCSKCWPQQLFNVQEILERGGLMTPSCTPLNNIVMNFNPLKSLLL